jgi:Bifunctional DNA primase/polymerase, N-terminal/Primase C terminal 1 (PriCT-1)
MTSTQENERLAAALDYLSRGWSVLPMEPRAKRPLVPWRMLQSKAATASAVREWYRRRPGANVGIVTGRISGLIVLDVDTYHGGADSLAALESQHGELPATLESRTGGGGRHLYFRHPGPATMNRTGIRPGLDLRGDGGCVVAPPSIHPNGRRYAWVKSRSPDDIAPAAPPQWLLAVAAPVPKGHSRAHWRTLVRDGVTEGQRNSSLASLAGHLLAHEVDLEVVRELLLCWSRVRCRPPLEDAEVARVVTSIAGMHQRDQGPGRGIS